MTQSGGIIQYLQSVQAYISPPIAAAFLLGLFFKRINSRGAIISLWTGFTIGIFRLVCEFMVQNEVVAIGDNFLIDLIVAPNFLHFALYLFLFCSVLLIITSMSAPQHTAEKLKGVTFDKTAEDFFEIRRVDVIYTVGLVLLVLAVWYIFSPLGIG
jgi:SSS family solute:Na+ symporter